MKMQVFYCYFVSKTVEDLGNIAMLSNFIYNNHILSYLFLSSPFVIKSLRKDFLCKVNLAGFKRAVK